MVEEQKLAVDELRKLTRLERASNLWLWLALACLFALVGYFVEPNYAQENPVVIAAGTWGLAWVFGFAISGILLGIGILTGRSSLEVFGLITLAGSLGINWLAVVLINPAATGVVVYPALIGTASARIALLLYLKQLKESRRGP